MKAFKAALSLLTWLWAATSFALSCVSAGSGNYSTTGNWSSCGGGVPGNGDTITVGHAITVDSNRTVGTSPAEGTVVVTVNSGGGSLTVAAGVTLTVRGAIALNDAGLTLGAGSILELDASAATDPTNQQYELRIGTAHNQTNARLTVNGTSGSRATIRSNASGGNGYITDGTGPWLAGGLLTATYVDFLRIGDATNNAIRFSPTGSSTFSLTNATFTSGGRLGGTYNWGATANVTIQNVTMASTAHSTDSLRIENGSGYTSGTRLIDGNVFDKQVHAYTGAGLTVTGNLFAGTFDATAGDWVSGSGNMFLDQNNLMPGSASDSYFIDPDATDNPHYMQPLAQTAPTYSGLIFECPACVNSSDAGDGVLIPSPASAILYTITNSLSLPSNTGVTSGCIFSALGNANATIAAYHNVYYVTANTGTTPAPALGTVGETFNTATGALLFKSNIAASSSTRTDYLLRNVNGAPNNDVCNSTGCNYNAAYNMAAGSELKGYNLPVTGSPGANDVSSDPQFVDPTRDLGTFDAAFCNGGGTHANAIATLKLKNTPSAVATCTIANALTHVKAGFKVRNIAYKDAGHDGVTIGAFGYEAASGHTRRTMMGVG